MGELRFPMLVSATLRTAACGLLVPRTNRRSTSTGIPLSCRSDKMLPDATGSQYPPPRLPCTTQTRSDFMEGLALLAPPPSGYWERMPDTRLRVSGSATTQLRGRAIQSMRHQYPHVSYQGPDALLRLGGGGCDGRLGGMCCPLSAQQPHGWAHPQLLCTAREPGSIPARFHRASARALCTFWPLRPRMVDETSPPLGPHPSLRGRLAASLPPWPHGTVTVGVRLTA